MYVRSTFPETAIRKHNSMGKGTQRCIILRNFYLCLPALGYVKLKLKVPQKHHGSIGLHIKRGCTQDLQVFLRLSAIYLHGIHRLLQGIYKLLPLNAEIILGLDFAWPACGSHFTHTKTHLRRLNNFGRSVRISTHNSGSNILRC